jgi:hypothetical protein
MKKRFTCPACHWTGKAKLEARVSGGLYAHCPDGHPLDDLDVAPPRFAGLRRRARAFFDWRRSEVVRLARWAWKKANTPIRLRRKKALKAKPWTPSIGDRVWSIKQDEPGTLEECEDEEDGRLHFDGDSGCGHCVDMDRLAEYVRPITVEDARRHAAASLAKEPEVPYKPTPTYAASHAGESIAAGDYLTFDDEGRFVKAGNLFAPYVALESAEAGEWVKVMPFMTAPEIDKTVARDHPADRLYGPLVNVEDCYDPETGDWVYKGFAPELPWTADQIAARQKNTRPLPGVSDVKSPKRELCQLCPVCGAGDADWTETGAACVDTPTAEVARGTREYTCKCGAVIEREEFLTEPGGTPFDFGEVRALRKKAEPKKDVTHIDLDALEDDDESEWFFVEDVVKDQEKEDRFPEIGKSKPWRPKVGEWVWGGETDLHEARPMLVDRVDDDEVHVLYYKGCGDESGWTIEGNEAIACLLRPLRPDEIHQLPFPESEDHFA